MVSTTDPSMDNDFEVIPDQNANQLSVSLTADRSREEVLITITPPAEPRGDVELKKKRAAVDFVLTIDVSGSMGEQANIPGDTEESGLTILDIVKHAAKTIIASMGDNDRVGIVAFSSEAKVALQLTQTNDVGRKKAVDAVERLRTLDSTNIWGGLKSSLNVIKDAPPFVRSDFSEAVGDMKITDSSARRLSSIFLLTDGLPNVNPPRGHIPMLRSYIEATPQVANTTINAMGFGYNLDSYLLHAIAQVGRGTFGFIADAGMVGTIFVHAVANVYAVWSEGVEITINAMVNGSPTSFSKTPEVIGGYNTTSSKDELKVLTDPLLYGQSRDILLKVPTGLFGQINKLVLSVKVKATPWNTGSAATASAMILLATANKDNSAEPRMILHETRSALVSEMYKMLKVEARPLSDGSASKTSLYQRLNPALRRIQSSANENLKTLENLVSGFDKRISGAVDASDQAIKQANSIIEDVKSQVILCLRDPTMLSRWGTHYMLSLARAHQRQTCINFKDLGMQAYGSDSNVFKAWRNEIDNLFDNLPPPKPSIPAYIPPPPQWAGGGPLYSQHSAAAAPPSGAPAQLPPISAYRPPIAPPAPGGMLFGSARVRPQQPQQQGLQRAWKPGFSMSSYNQQQAPCFSGSSLIRLADGTTIPVEKLRGGVTLKTLKGPRQAVGVIKTVVQAGSLELCEIGGLLVTPWHPIKLDTGKWTFPADVVKAESKARNAVYSILLEADPDSDAHSVEVGGVWCVTLGHGVKTGEDVRAHAFLGDYEACLNALLPLLEHNSTGIAEATGLNRDSKTGLMVGFKWKSYEMIGTTRPRGLAN